MVRKASQVPIPQGPATPRYKVGEQKGNFTVIAYEGHSLMNPETLVYLSKRQHWYEVKCGCGNTEIINQAQLNAREMCKECADVIKSDRISAARKDAEAKKRGRGRPEKVVQTNVLPPHLDFARMKLK